jgi:hypothetical protein
MLESLQKKWHKKLEKIRQSTDHTKEDTKSLDLSQVESIQELQLNLYDTPRKLNVETFYEIMATGNVQLLKVNPKEEINPEILSELWIEFQEYYYSQLNNTSWKKFIRNLRKVRALEAQLIGCYAAFNLVKLGVDYGYEKLNNFGIRQRDEKGIESSILRKETNLEFAKNKLLKTSQRKVNEENKKESSEFYRYVGFVEDALKRSIITDGMNLEKWMTAYLLRALAIQKQLEQSNNKNKRKRK